MTLPQIEILSLLAVALVLFGWGRWRHDVVALAVLFVAVGLGLVKAEEAFAGFGHPAVITVAAAVVISRTIYMTGILDRIATLLTARTTNPVLIRILLCLPSGIASGFMNNIAALALVMPVAIAVCQNAGHSPSMVLMPLSYITVLGGVLTLIGTPPNIIISGIRADRLGEGFKLFDFAPLGLAILITGTLFVAFIGWRFIPQRISAGRTGSGRVQEYLLEATVDEESPLIGKLLGDVSVILEDSDAGLLGLKRGSVTVPGAAQWTQVRAGDVLLIEAAPDTVGPLLGPLSLSLVKPGRDVPVENKANDLHIAEAVVRPYGAIIGLTPAELRLRQRFTVNLLGVAREGTNTFSGLKDWRFNAGDVMLLQGEEDCVEDAISELGLLPLEQRDLTLQRPSTALPTLAIALAGLGALILELAPAAVCLGAAATLLL